MLKLLLFKNYTGDELKQAIYAESLAELEDKTRRYLTEHKYELIGLSDKDGGTEMVYWRHYALRDDLCTAPTADATDAHPEAAMTTGDYLDRNLTDEVKPFEYDANLDYGFDFLYEEWSLGVEGDISAEVFSEWDKALDYFIKHLRQYGRIVAATREEFDAYRLECARKRDDWWHKCLKEHLDAKKQVERSLG
jgi:hypothetical protein